MESNPQKEKDQQYLYKLVAERDGYANKREANNEENKVLGQKIKKLNEEIIQIECQLDQKTIIHEPGLPPVAFNFDSKS
jgi:hypothetical protein